MREPPTPSSFSRRRTTDMGDMLWLHGVQPLIQEPSGVIVFADERSRPREVDISKWIAFSAAAVALNVDWGLSYGAVRTQTIHHLEVTLDVVSWMGRMGILVRDSTPEFPTLTALEFCRRFEGVRHKDRFSIDWAAAAFTLEVMEGDE